MRKLVQWFRQLCARPTNDPSDTQEVSLVIVDTSRQAGELHRRRYTVSEENSDSISTPFEKTEEIRQKAIRKAPSSTGFLVSQLVIGVSRDYGWAMVSRSERNLFKGSLGVFWGQTATQMIFSAPWVFAATNLCLTPIKSSLFLDIRRDWTRKAVSIGAASWSAIPVWNGAAYLSTLATRSPWLQGIFTGIAETVWVNGIVTPLLSKQPIKKLDVALNTLSGAVWLWAFEEYADFPANYSSAVVALQVAAATLWASMLSLGIEHYGSIKQTFFAKRLRQTVFAEPPTDLTQPLLMRRAVVRD